MRNVVLHSVFQTTSGSTKPPLKTVMRDLADQLNVINEIGIFLEVPKILTKQLETFAGLPVVIGGIPKRVKFVVALITVDLMARAPLASIQNPTAYNACLFCETTALDVETARGGRVRQVTEKN